MSRYIDADILIRDTIQEYTRSNPYRDAIIRMVNKAPTVELKCGEWERVSADKYVRHAYHYYRCSECGYDHIGKTNFCPNCGADMRGAGDE